MSQTCAFVAVALAALHIVLAHGAITVDQPRRALRQVVLAISATLCAVAFGFVAVLS